MSNSISPDRLPEALNSFLGREPPLAALLIQKDKNPARPNFHQHLPEDFPELKAA